MKESKWEFPEWVYDIDIPSYVKAIRKYADNNLKGSPEYLDFNIAYNEWLDNVRIVFINEYLEKDLLQMEIWERERLMDYKVL